MILLNFEQNKMLEKKFIGNYNSYEEMRKLQSKLRKK